MRALLALVISLAVISGLTFGSRALLRLANRRIWQLNILDRIAFWLPYTVFFLIGLTFLATRFKWLQIAAPTMTLLSVLVVSSLILTATLPLVLLATASGKLWKKGKPEAESVDENRRRFLKTATAAAPGILLASTGAGFAGGFQKVRLPQVEMTFENLPRALDGLKILHISDAHLGYYTQLNDLEQLLLRAEAQQPDLVLTTGDLSDDLNQLPGALKLIEQFPGKHPKYISIGNHEYFRGLKQFVRETEKSSVRFLRNRGETIEINGVPFYIAGADDPVALNADIRDFMRDTTLLSMRDAPTDAFKLLMSHRPMALDSAPQMSTDLILAGHTHGGQVGMNGRSLFDERLKNERYLWGKYKKGNTQLYTSSGVGHWFPFRLGCPPEAPILVLHRGQKSIT